ncbi:hypothetical protein [Vibrio coralliilyticus]|uniref:hypothetical protein n=1 Tax=Vibrio coralliilyticus TaxID=190893 RepID=UPI000363F422|nr:hypothetical protein [Vibrio coralliilyticus]
MENKWYLYLIIILVFLLVGMSLYVLKLRQSGVEEQVKQLPDLVSSRERNIVLQEFIHHWNNNDEQSLNNMFSLGDSVSLIEFLSRWKSSVGDIAEGNYNSYEYVEAVENEHFYRLFYILQFEKSVEGFLLVDIYVDDKRYRLVGFNVGVYPDD